MPGRFARGMGLYGALGRERNIRREFFDGRKRRPLDAEVAVDALGDLIRGEPLRQFAERRHRDAAGLFGNHQRQAIGLFGDPDGGAMARPSFSDTAGWW